MLGLILWALLILFVCICITPWWFIPSVIAAIVIGEFLINSK